MNPFFFGNSGNQLFGAYDPPAMIGRRGVVLCYPLAWEYMRAHGTFRLLARRLAAAGHHVLRFDYSGTGDSAGEFEAASVEQWITDIHTAIDELRDMTQVRQVALIGMRFGAVLAAQATRGRSDVDRLALWDPVVDGASYLSSLGVTVGADLAGASSVCEAQGVLFTPRLRREIASTTLECFSSALPRTLHLSTGPSDADSQELRSHFSSIGVQLASEHAPDIPVWAVQRDGAVVMPVAAVNAIVEWMQ